jgi:hypothetical protein
MAWGYRQITAFAAFTAFSPPIEKTVTGWSGGMTSGAQFRILGTILGIYRNRHASNVSTVYPPHKKEMQTHLVTSRPALKNDPFCNH